MDFDPKPAAATHEQFVVTADGLGRHQIHEDHGSSAPRAIVAGLRSVFRPRPAVHDANIAELMRQRMADVAKIMEAE